MAAGGSDPRQNLPRRKNWNHPPAPGNCAPPRWKVFMTSPKLGEVYWVDLGLKGKAAPAAGRLARRRGRRARPVRLRAVDHPDSRRRLRGESAAGALGARPDEGVANVQGLTSVENHRLER